MKKTIQNKARQSTIEIQIGFECNVLKRLLEEKRQKDHMVPGLREAIGSQQEVVRTLYRTLANLKMADVITEVFCGTKSA